MPMRSCAPSPSTSASSICPRRGAEQNQWTVISGQ
jgi:hypothetical protein